MKKRLRSWSGALLLSALSFVTVSCGKKDKPDSSSGSSSGSSPSSSWTSTADAPPLAASEWGFAARLPKSTEGFLAFYRLGDLVTQLRESSFAKKLQAVPGFPKDMTFARIDAELDKNPDLRAGLSIYGTEFIVALPEGFTENLLKLGKLLAPLPEAVAESAKFNATERQKYMRDPKGDYPMMTTPFDMMVQQYAKPEYAAMLEEVLMTGEVPSLILAARAGSVRTLLDQKMNEVLKNLPPQVAQMVEPGAFKLDDKYDFKSLTLSVAKSIPPQGAERMKAQLTQLLRDPAKGAAAAEKLMSKTLEFSWGWVDDTFVLTVGKDHSHLKLASANDSVLTLPEISSRAAAWQAKKPFALTWSSQKANVALTEAANQVAKGIITMWTHTIGAEVSPVPLDGIAADLKKLMDRANEIWPDKVTASVAAAWWDGGLHAESFGGLVDETMDSSKPLTFESFAGPATVLLSVGRVNEANSQKTYDFMEEAADTLWTSFKTNVRPKLPKDMQAGLAMGEMAVPLVKTLWKSIRTFQSALGAESALLVNLDGAMPPLPNIPEAMKSMPAPRLVAVCELKDRAKLTEAWNGLSGTIGAVAAMAGSKEKFAPVEKQEGSATLWGFPLPMDLGDLWPHTAVAGDRFYLGTSVSFTKETAAKSPAPAGPACGSHLRVNFKPVWDYAASFAATLSRSDQRAFNEALPFLRSLEEIDIRTGSENGDSHVKIFIGIKDTP